MSNVDGSWPTYLRLLDEQLGTDEAERALLDQARSEYERQARQLQHELDKAERRTTGLADRNRRLQIAVRDLAHRAGATIPNVHDVDPFPDDELDLAIKSAEYDVEQLGRSLDYARQRPTPAPQTPARPSAPAMPPTSPAPDPQQTPATGGSKRAVLVAAAIGVVAALVVILALI